MNFLSGWVLSVEYKEYPESFLIRSRMSIEPKSYWSHNKKMIEFISDSESKRMPVESENVISWRATETQV